MRPARSAASPWAAIPAPRRPTGRAASPSPTSRPTVWSTVPRRPRSCWCPATGRRCGSTAASACQPTVSPTSRSRRRSSTAPRRSSARSSGATTAARPPGRSPRPACCRRSRPTPCARCSPERPSSRCSPSTPTASPTSAPRATRPGSSTCSTIGGSPSPTGPATSAPTPCTTCCRGRTSASSPWSRGPRRCWSCEVGPSSPTTPTCGRRWRSRARCPRPPSCVTVDHAEVRDEPALAAAHLWEVDRHIERGTLPRASQIWVDHVALHQEVDQVAAEHRFALDPDAMHDNIEANYRDGLY